MDEQKYRALFANKGILSNGILCLTSSEAHALLNSDAVLLDTRKEHETNYRIFDVPEMCFYTKSQIKEHYPALSRDKPYIIADSVGMGSREIAKFLIERGFENVAILSGGIIDWVKQKLPVKKDPNYELRGQCGCKVKPVNPKEKPSHRPE